VNLGAWLVLTRNQFLGFLREPAASGFNVLVPLFIVVVQAVAYGSRDANGLDGYRVADVLPISAATMFVMIIGIFGMGIGLASMIEGRSVAAYRLRPGGVTGLLSAYATVLLGLIVLGFGLSLAALWVGWSIKAPDRPWAIVPALLLSAVFFLSFGAIGGALGGSPRSAQALSSMLFFPFLFLSGAMFPLDDFPKPLRVIASVLPGKHAYELFSYAWVRSEDFPGLSLTYLAGGGLALFTVAVAVLSHRERL